jgi:hypothetical protein
VLPTAPAPRQPALEGRQESSAFLKKSAQKTFDSLGLCRFQILWPRVKKVFCFFLLKKKRLLPSLDRRTPPWFPPAARL